MAEGQNSLFQQLFAELTEESNTTQTQNTASDQAKFTFNATTERRRCVLGSSGQEPQRHQTKNSTSTAAAAGSSPGAWRRRNTETPGAVEQTPSPRFF